VVSFAAIGKQVGYHIERAVQMHLDNEAVCSISVLSETPHNLLGEAFPLLSHDKVSYRHFGHRPNFRDMLNRVEELLVEGDCDVAAVMNGDMAFASAENLRVAARTLMDLALKHPTVFSLTRYDVVAGRSQISLRSAVGLPNIMSADTWMFASPPKVDADLFYCPGQMFCDQFMNHDLIQAGYRVFNPCLDCVTLHQEADTKNQSYYREESNKEANQRAMKRHWENAVTQADGHYFGVCHTSCAALQSGYRPRPAVVNEDRRKAFLLLTHWATVQDVQKYVSRFNIENCDIYLLVEDFSLPDGLEEWLYAQGKENIYITKVFSLHDVMRELFQGMDIHWSNLLCATDSAALSPSDFAQFDNIFQICGGTVQGDPTLLALHNLPRRVTDFVVDCLFAGRNVIASWARQPGHSQANMAYLTQRQTDSATNMEIQS